MAERAQQLKYLLCKPNMLNSIPGAQKKVEGEN